MAPLRTLVIFSPARDVVMVALRGRKEFVSSRRVCGVAQLSNNPNQNALGTSTPRNRQSTPASHTLDQVRQIHTHKPFVIVLRAIRHE